MWLSSQLENLTTLNIEKHFFTFLNIERSSASDHLLTVLGGCCCRIVRAKVAVAVEKGEQSGDDRLLLEELIVRMFSWSGPWFGRQSQENMLIDDSDNVYVKKIRWWKENLPLIAWREVDVVVDDDDGDDCQHQWRWQWQRWRWQRWQTKWNKMEKKD